MRLPFLSAKPPAPLCPADGDSLRLATLADAPAYIEAPDINAVIARRDTASLAAAQRLLDFLGPEAVQTRSGGWQLDSLRQDLSAVLDRFFPADAAALPIFAAGRAALLDDLESVARLTAELQPATQGAVILWSQPFGPMAPQWHQDEAQLVATVTYSGGGTQTVPNSCVNWGAARRGPEVFATDAALASDAITAAPGDILLMKGRGHPHCRALPKSSEPSTAAVHRAHPGHRRIVAVLAVG